MANVANLTTSFAMESTNFVAGAAAARNALKQLQNQLDPAGKAQAAFNKQITQAKQLYEAGAISLERYDFYVDAAEKKLGTMIRRQQIGIQASGEMRAGFQQLSYQLGDVATGLATGQHAMTIFAQQGTQVVQAIQLMSGETKGLLGVLAGPWGIAMTAAATLAVSLGSALFDGADAADAMAKHQDDLADYVDMTTGKIKAQIAAVMLLAEVQRQSKTLGEQVGTYQKSRSALIGAGQINDTRIADSYRFGGSGYAPPETASEKQIEKLADQYRRGEISANAFGVAANKIGLADPAIRKTTDEIVRLADSTVRSAQSAIKTKAAIAALSGTATDAQKAILGIKVANDNTSASDTRAASAAHSHATAVRSVTTATKDLDAVERERLQVIRALQDKYDPAAAAVRDYADALKQIAAVKLDPATAERYADAARVAFEKARAGMFDLPSVEGFRSDAEAADKLAQDSARAAEEQERKLQRQREDNIRSLGGIYMDAFEGGTKAVWRDFQRIGFDVISQLLAKWTESAFTKGGSSGGGLGELFSGVGKILGLGGGGPTVDIGAARAGADAALASIPHFANGGSFQFGGRDGIDKNVLSLNGSPIAKVSRGETATIGSGRGGGAPVVHQTFDMRGAVVTQELLAQVNAQAMAGTATVLGHRDKKQAKAATRRLGR